VATIAEYNSGQEQKRQREADQQKQANSRSALVAKLLAAGPDIREFMNDLLTVQAIVVNGTEAAGFLLEQSPEGMKLTNVAHIRPDNSDEETRKAALQAFSEIIGECLKQDKDGVINVGSPIDSGEPQFCLVTILRNEHQVVAASAVITRCRDEERARQRLETMRLVAGYFDLWLLKRSNEQTLAVGQRHQDVLQSAAAFANGEGFLSSAANLCNELVSRTNASRVSLGWVKMRSVKLLAMSNTEEFDKKQELSVGILKAMEECVDQGEVVQYDPDPAGHTTNNITRGAMGLSRLESGNKIVSLPLRNRNEVVGVMTLEYPPNRALTPQITTSLAVLAEVMAPQIHDRYQDDRWIPVKIGRSIVYNSKFIIGPRHTLAKTVFASVLILTAFFLFYSPMYKVKAPFQFIAENRRLLSPPFEGVIEAVYHVPGEFVKAGTPLLKLKTVELEKQRIKASQSATASFNRAQAALFDRDKENDWQHEVELSQAKAFEAEAALYTGQINKATIVAPIDGMILRGDLKEKIGSSIRESDPLMEIAPIDNGQLQAEIRLNERDIEKVRPGSVGQLATTSSPNKAVDIKITRIVPLGEAKDAKNTFRVFAEITSPPDSAWQPGQEGEARINWQTKPLYYHGLSRLWEWVQLKLWI